MEASFMIKYVKVYDWDKIENFLLRHPDFNYTTKTYMYTLKQIGDCTGIFRHKHKDPTHEELCAYYHEGEV